VLWLAFVVVAPVGEEITFRGFLFRGWAASRLGVSGTILLSALTFTALHAHYDWFETLQVFLIGTLFGWLRWRSGSTTLTILLHLVANLLATLLAAGQGAWCGLVPGHYRRCWAGTQTITKPCRPEARPGAEGRQAHRRHRRERLYNSLTTPCPQTGTTSRRRARSVEGQRVASTARRAKEADYLLPSALRPRHISLSLVSQLQRDRAEVAILHQWTGGITWLTARASASSALS
jgi:hypothetical protein